MGLRLGLLILVGSLLPTLVHGQLVGGSTGTLAGRVHDPDGNAIAGARLVLTGPPPALRRTLLSDLDGGYRFAGLPPGLYAIEATQTNHSTAAAERLDLRTDETLRVDFRLEPGHPSKFTITTQPRIDVTSAGTDAHLDLDGLESLPRDRTVDSLFSLVAVVFPDRQAGRIDEILGAVSVRGASIAETAVLWDGIDSSDTRTGAPRLRLPVELVTGFQVKSAGFSPDYGGTVGAVVHVLTRAGGADWHGGATLQYTEDGLVSDPPERRLASGGSADDALSPIDRFELVDLGAWLGGPLHPSRAWLFAGYLPQLGKVGDQRADRTSASAKLDLRPRQDLLLGLSGIRVRSDAVNALAEVVPDLPLPGVTPLTGEDDVESGRFLFGWNARPGLVLTGTIGQYEAEIDRGPFGWHETQRRLAFASTASSFFRGAGQHTLALGIQGVEPHSTVTSPEAADARALVDGDTAALWLQDSWQPTPRLTLDLGLRTSRERVIPRHGGQELDFDFGERIAPRLGIALDVRGDGQWKVYGSAGLLYDQLEHHLALVAFELPSAAEREIVVDPGLEAPSSLLFSMGTDNQVLPNLRVSAEVFYRQLQEGMTLLALVPDDDGGRTATAAIVNPGSGLGARPYGDELPAHPGLERESFGLELVARARFANWTATLSYLGSLLEGNYDGLANADDPIAPLSPNVGDACSTLEGCYNAFGTSDDGPLALDRRHQLRLHGTWRFQSGLVLGGFLRLATGTPFARHVAVQTTDGGTDPVVSRLWKPEGRSSGERLDTFTQIDFRLQYDFELGRSRCDLSLFLDLLNVFDESATLARSPNAYLGLLEVDRSTFFAGFDVDRAVAEQGLEPDPTFGEALRTQTPRRLRLGLRLRF